ncbi:MAG: fatty acid desaturase, partial [Spirochaetales bacterium]|nr:fatty acid desaturase [Spirochaetales bacterium]
TNLLLGVVPFLFYSFLLGFLNGIEHEMRHNIVFPKSMDWFNNAVFFLIHVLYKDGSRYQRASHRIHHQYTMVRGVDPETDYPETLTEQYLRRFLLKMVFGVLTLGIPSLLSAFGILIQRMAGKTNPLVLARCSEKDKRIIRLESWVIFLINIAASALFIIFRQWFLIALLMLAPRIGLIIVGFWFHTEHLSMMHNSSDQRLCTRGVKVSLFVRFLYGGLDEHVEHHLFPAVPSRNLSALRMALDWNIPARQNVIQCWREIFSIARHLEKNPDDVFVPEGMSV